MGIPQLRLCFVLAAGLFGAAVMAQVPEDVRNRLAKDAVVSTDTWYFASASGTIRGTRETEEDRLATRAMQALARAMCQFEPSTGKRLEASIRGFSMVSSTLRGRELEVIMRAPLQAPVCRVLSVESSPLAAQQINNAAQSSVPETASQRDITTRILEPAYIREKNMTIRIFGGEY